MSYYWYYYIGDYENVWVSFISIILVILFVREALTTINVMDLRSISIGWLYMVLIILKGPWSVL